MSDEIQLAAKLFQVRPEEVDEDQLRYAKKWLSQVDYGRDKDKRSTKDLLAPTKASSLNKEQLSRAVTTARNCLLQGRRATHERKFG